VWFRADHRRVALPAIAEASRSAARHGLIELASRAAVVEAGLVRAVERREQQGVRDPRAHGRAVAFAIDCLGERADRVPVDGAEPFPGACGRARRLGRGFRRDLAERAHAAHLGVRGARGVREREGGQLRARIQRMDHEGCQVSTRSPDARVVLARPPGHGFGVRGHERAPRGVVRAELREERRGKAPHHDVGHAVQARAPHVEGRHARDRRQRCAPRVARRDGRGRVHRLDGEKRRRRGRRRGNRGRRRRSGWRRGLGREDEHDDPSRRPHCIPLTRPSYASPDGRLLASCKRTQANESPAWQRGASRASSPTVPEPGRRTPRAGAPRHPL
jgi:hypothetical protein